MIEWVTDDDKGKSIVYSYTNYVISLVYFSMFNFSVIIKQKLKFVEI